MKILILVISFFLNSLSYSSELEWMPKLYTCFEQVNNSKRYDVHVESDNDRLIVAEFEDNQLVRKLLTFHADGIHNVEYDYKIEGLKASYILDGYDQIAGGSLRLEKVKNQPRRLATLSLLDSEGEIKNLNLYCESPVKIYWGNSIVLLNDYPFKLSVPAILKQKCPKAFKNRDVEIAKEAKLTLTNESKIYDVSFESFNQDGSLAQKFKAKISKEACQYCSFNIQQMNCR